MDMLAAALERIFRKAATSAVIRDIESSENITDLWSEIESSGFLDILLPEANSGAGLPLSDAFSSFFLAGYYGLPVPFVQTVMARGWLRSLGFEAPDGVIAIGGPETIQVENVSLNAYNVAYGKVADWVLAEFNDLWVLLPTSEAKITGDAARGSQTADLLWASQPQDILNIAKPEGPQCSPAQLCAASLSPMLAGAARQVFDMTLKYVSEREQFGKPIAKFQAVQGQISIMAERVWAMRMAAQLACYSQTPTPSYRLAAVGKARCSEAAVTVADLAHALHGAIGITEEYDLQLFTRKLRDWRRAGGTEGWWARQLGQELIQTNQADALDFVLESTR